MWGHFCCRHIGKDILDSVPATVEEGVGMASWGRAVGWLCAPRPHVFRMAMVTFQNFCSTQRLETPLIILIMSTKW